MKPVILLVDDSESDVFLFETALEMSGMEAQLIVLNNATAATEYLAAGHRPDYLLLDLNMPGRDGFYVLEQLQETPDYPLIILTSSSSAADRERAARLGASRFMTKPMSLAELVQMITGLLAA